MVAMENAVGSEHMGDKPVCQDTPTENGVLTVADVQEYLFCAGVFQKLCSMDKRTTTGADVINNQDIPVSHLLWGAQFHPLDFAGAPVTALFTEHVSW